MSITAATHESVTEVDPGTRPPLSRHSQIAGAAFGLWMVVGLFLDGWAHDNNQPETFFTPWHGVLYSGFAAAGAAAVLVALRSRQPGRPVLATLPRGHGLTLAALAVFAVGAVGDLVWHETLGIEVGVEALLSPTHLVLLVGGVVALSAPVRAAWNDSPTVPASLREFAPTVFSLSLLAALIGFFLLYLSPFVNDAAGTEFARLPGATHEHPSTDAAELRQLLGIASILVTTLVFTVPGLLMLRRWQPPAGSFTVLFTTITVLFAGLDEFAQPWTILAGIAGGIAADAVRRRWAPWAVVALAAVVLWSGYFATYHLTAGGVAWSPALWSGTIVLAGLVAATLGLVSAAPGTGGDRSTHALAPA